MLSWLDYVILIVPLAFVYYMAFYSRKYIRGVVDFLATGRLCGRYVMSVASVASGLSIIGVVAHGTQLLHDLCYSTDYDIHILLGSFLADGQS